RTLIAGFSDSHRSRCASTSRLSVPKTICSFTALLRMSHRARCIQDNAQSSNSCVVLPQKSKRKVTALGNTRAYFTRESLTQPGSEEWDGPGSGGLGDARFIDCYFIAVCFDGSECDHPYL